MLRRRAPKACSNCRARKVKCDVSGVGIPCTNCNRTASACRVDETRKRRLDAEPSNIRVPISNLHAWELEDPVATQPAGENEGSSRAGSTTAYVNRSKPIEAQNEGSIDLPSYVAPISSTLSPIELNLLRRQGALVLPPKPLMDDLLRVYILYVHPLLPVVELDEVLSAIDGRASPRLSLVLLQAVLFAGASFVDKAHLISEGYQTRKAARKAFFRRVKILYDADAERNPFTTIQVLLLMTYWCERQNDTKGQLYWLRIALSLASDIGLDRVDASSSLRYKDRQWRSRRRLWYCCIIRAHSLSVSERRHVAITKEAVPNINNDEIYEETLAKALTPLYGQMSDDSARSLSILCAQQVKLCLIIGSILNSQYERNGLRRVNSRDTFMILIPKLIVNGNDKPTSLDADLRQWYTETGSLRSAMFGQDHRRNGQVVGVHSATLEILYYTALSMTHRPQLLQQRLAGSAREALQAFSHQTLRHAAQRISEIGRQLDEGHLICFLPPVAVTAFAIASVQHLKDALCAEADLRSTGQLYLSQTIHLLNALDDMYHSAQCAVDFIERVRRGDLPYESFEWEDGATHISMNDSSTRQNVNCQTTSSTPSHDETMTGARNSAPGSNSRHIDAISDVLLSVPFDPQELDWTTMRSIEQVT